MILKSITKVGQIKAAFKRLGISVAPKKLPIAVSFDLGFWLIDVYIDGNVNVSDKTGAEDAFVFAMSKPLTDVATIVETVSKAFGRAFADGSAITDNDVLLVGKVFADPTTMTDAFSHAHSKVLANIVGVTDDIDAAASILDDQEMQFVKNTTNATAITDLFTRVVAFNRTFTDPTTMTDDESWSLGKSITELPSVTDAGSLRSHSYCDITFFGEDFVGASRTF